MHNTRKITLFPKFDAHTLKNIISEGKKGYSGEI